MEVGGVNEMDVLRKSMLRGLLFSEMILDTLCINIYANGFLMRKNSL